MDANHTTPSAPIENLAGAAINDFERFFNKI